MGYDEALALRVREALAAEDGVTERRMFGGLGFMLHGHMAVAAGSRGGLMVRIDPARGDGLVDGEHVRRTVMRGRELDGWLDVDPEAVASDDDLERWVAEGAAYVRTLPPK